MSKLRFPTIAFRQMERRLVPFALSNFLLHHQNSQQFRQSTLRTPRFLTQSIRPQFGRGHSVCVHACLIPQTLVSSPRQGELIAN